MELGKFAHKGALREFAVSHIIPHSRFVPFAPSFRKNIRPFPKPSPRPCLIIYIKMVRVRYAELLKRDTEPPIRQNYIKSFFGRQVNITNHCFEIIFCSFFFNRFHNLRFSRRSRRYCPDRILKIQDRSFLWSFFDSFLLQPLNLFF